VNLPILDIFLQALAAATAYLALVVFVRDTKNPVNKSFAILLLLSVFWGVAISFFRLSPTLESALLWDRTVYIAGTLVPSVFLLFSYIFTHKHLPPFPYVVLTWGIISIFLVALFYTDWWIRTLIPTAYGWHVELGWIYFPWMVYYFVFMGWGFYHLLRRYQTSKGLIRTQLQYVFIAILFPVVGAVMPNVILPWLGNYRLIALGPLFSFPMAAIIAYAIVRHRLLDIRKVVAKYTVYLLLLLFLTSIYGLTLFLTTAMLAKNQTVPQVVTTSLLSALVIAVTFVPLQKFLERSVKRLFFQSSYETDATVLELSRAMAGTLDQKDLAHRILAILQTTLKPACAAIVLAGKPHSYVACVNAQHSPPLEPAILRRIASATQPLLVSSELEDPSLKAIFEKHHLAVFVKLVVGSDMVGYLLLGEKASDDIYFSQDITLLQILAPELAVALQNSTRYEQIKQFADTLRQKVKIATADLRLANLHLKELDKLKDEFIALASHELRTPLTAIRGYVWLLLDEQKKQKLSALVVQQLNQINMSTERVVALINDLLNVSQIESGRMKLMPEKMDIRALSREVITEMQAQAAAKRITLNAKQLMPLWIQADKTRIREVVMNLVSNALKFTPVGGSVTVEHRKKDARVETSVNDNGIGIAKADIPKLFTKFGRLDTTLATIPKTQGTGLGLYIVKKIVDLHGGTMRVSSTPGKGSIFTFTLPSG